MLLALATAGGLVACAGQPSQPTAAPRETIAQTPAAPSSGSGSSTAPPAAVDPLKLPTAVLLTTPQDVPIGRPTSEEAYKKLKEDAQQMAPVTPASGTPDHR